MDRAKSTFCGAFFAKYAVGLASRYRRAKASGMQRNTSLFPLLVTSLLVTGCASSSKTYPSLAIRDAERVNGSFEVAGSEPVNSAVPLGPDVLKQLDQIGSIARDSHQKFVAAAPATRRIVTAGAGSPVTSTRWTDAQVALSDLDSLHSTTTLALADLDLMFADATIDFTQREAIAERRDAVIQYVRAEKAILAALRRQTGL